MKVISISITSNLHFDTITQICVFEDFKSLSQMVLSRFRSYIFSFWQ